MEKWKTKNAWKPVFLINEKQKLLINQCFGNLKDKKCLKSSVFEKWETEIAYKPVFWEIERQKMIEIVVFL